MIIVELKINSGYSDWSILNRLIQELLKVKYIATAWLIEKKRLNNTCFSIINVLDSLILKPCQ